MASLSVFAFGLAWNSFGVHDAVDISWVFFILAWNALAGFCAKNAHAVVAPSAGDSVQCNELVLQGDIQLALAD